MNGVVYHYGIRLQGDGTIGTFPAVEVRFLAHEGGEDVPVTLLLDSGATISALPAVDAEALGIAIETGEKMHLYGISHQPLLAYRHQLSCKIGDIKLTIPVVFTTGEAVPRVLGRIGVFDQFSIVFEERKNRIGFFTSSSPASKIISRQIDAVS